MKHTISFGNFHGNVSQISACPSCEDNAWEFEIRDGFRDWLESNRFIHQICIGLTPESDYEHYTEIVNPRLNEDNFEDHKQFFDFIQYHCTDHIRYIQEAVKVSGEGWMFIEHPAYRETVERNRFNPPETKEEVIAYALT